MKHAAGTPAIAIIADDDDGHEIARLIRSLGMEPRVFASAEAAFEQAVGRDDACLLLDISMPRLSSDQLLEYLGQVSNGIPVIAISSRDDHAARVFARKLGAKLFLRKPVDAQALMDAINCATEGSLGATR